jgi:hypothetical protein
MSWFWVSENTKPRRMLSLHLIMSHTGWGYKVKFSYLMPVILEERLLNVPR